MQCNSCGRFEDIQPCPICSTLICNRCQTNHEMVCAEMQKKKKLGLGPTVRQILDTNLMVPLVAEPGIPQSDLVYRAALAAEVEPVVTPLPVVSAEVITMIKAIHETAEKITGSIPSSVVAGDGQTEPTEKTPSSVYPWTEPAAAVSIIPFTSLAKPVEPAAIPAVDFVVENWSEEFPG